MSILIISTVGRVGDVAVEHPHGKARLKAASQLPHAMESGIEWVRFDMLEKTSSPAALEGASAVFMMPPK